MKFRFACASLAFMLAGCAQMQASPPQAVTVSPAAAPVPSNVPAWQQGRAPDQPA